MNDFLKDIIKETGNEYATLASDGVTGGDVSSFIDTGSYAFNALLSGSIFGNPPKILPLMLYYQAVFLVDYQIIE
tara:strand:+ start:636 stop:860 length:225 start_codon:yes stop_codon:yes gene_type:complete